MVALPALLQTSLELPSRHAAPSIWVAPRKALVPSQSADYGEAMAVEVLSSAPESTQIGLTPPQAALRLYLQVARNPQPPAVSLHIIL
jgi:hypothetical protein